MVLAWENLEEIFVMLAVISFLILFFISFPGYFTMSPALTSAMVLSGHFLPTGVFYLTLLPDIFGTTCVYQAFPGIRQFFLEICRVSCWSLKHRPSPSVCLIHSNLQSFIHLKSVFIHINVAKSFTCGKILIKKYYFFGSEQLWKHKTVAILISNHKLQNSCSLKKHISEHKYKNYVNLCEFMGNKWCFNNKKCFYW